MGLRPDLEERVSACEAAIERTIEETRAQIAELDALRTRLEDDRSVDAIPEETFDDPSVVRHVEDLGRTARRIKRDSDAAALRRSPLR